MNEVKRFLAPVNDTCDMDSYQMVVLASDYDKLRERVVELEAELAAFKAQEPVVLPEPKLYHDYLPLFDKGYAQGHNDLLRSLNAQISGSKTNEQ